MRSRFAGLLPFGFGAALSLALVLLAPDGGAQKPARAPAGAAATEHVLASRAALDVLEQGGNAVDAAATAALVAGVVNPSSSGIGGGGFALVLPPGAQTPFAFDFREVAPRAVDRAALDRRPLPFAERGHLVGVPGEVLGLHSLVQRFGKKPWAEVVAPAERHARRGFAVGRHLARALGGGSEYAQEPGLAAVYFPGGRPAAEGRLLRNPKLADTLRRIGAEGPPAFYDGSVAAEIASTVRAAGGTLSPEDLRAYAVRERQALRVSWAGHEIYTMPPPSAGGLLLAQTLGTLGRDELVRLGLGSGAYQHLLAESFRATIADRFRAVGDPDHVNVDLNRLLDPERLARRRRSLAMDRTHGVPLFVSEEHGTHHLVVVDAAGGVVSLTTTVNRGFGAKLVTPDSGIALNDELDDFTRSEDARALGLGDIPNLPRPGARPVSSMTPTIALGARGTVALGGSGGLTIGTNVTQLLIARLAFGKTPEELVAAPRFYVFPRGPTLFLEDGAPQSLLDDLAFRGERVGKLSSSGSAVQVVVREGARLRAAADARKFGSAIVR